MGKGEREQERSKFSVFLLGMLGECILGGVKSSSKLYFKIEENCAKVLKYT
jgi:hypothetical protein